MDKTSKLVGLNNKPKKKLKINYSFWLFLAPALFAFTLVIIIPFFIGIYYSFTDWNAAGTSSNWIGLLNYTNLFSQSTQFTYSILITIIYSLFNIVLLNVVSFSLAMLVTRNLKFQNIYRVGFFLPNLVGGLILGYLWKFIFNNAIVAIGASFGFNWFSFLGDRNLAIIAISITWAWQYAGYIMMIYVTAIQNIPQELIEAAQIDGASPWARLKAITLPMMAPAFTVTLFLTLINSFKQFDVNYSLTQGGPSAVFNGINLWGTKLISMQIYDTWAVNRQPSLAQAQAIIFFIMLTVVSIAQVIVNKRREIES